MTLEDALKQALQTDEHGDLPDHDPSRSRADVTVENSYGDVRVLLSPVAAERLLAQIAR